MTAVPSRLSVAAVGVTDIAAAAAFYDRLGWRRSPLSNDHVVWFTTADTTIGLYPAPFLAAVRDVTQLATAGATLLRPPANQPWGGYSAFLRVHEGLVWEVTFNPAVRFAASGRTLFPSPRTGASA